MLWESWAQWARALKSDTAYIQTVQTTWTSPFRFGVPWMVLLVVSTTSVFTKFYDWLGQLIASLHQRPWEIILLVTSKGQTRDFEYRNINYGYLTTEGEVHGDDGDQIDNWKRASALSDTKKEKCERFIYNNFLIIKSFRRRCDDRNII